jgi:hypothetical protein
MAGKAAPDQRRWPIRELSCGCLEKKDKKVDERVCEKEVKQITKAIGRAFGDHLPEIPAVGATDALLSHKDCGKKYNEDAYVQAPKEIFGRNFTS